MIAIQNFKACVTTLVDGVPNFQLCRVVGIDEAGRFFVIVETEAGKLVVQAHDEIDVLDGTSPVHWSE